MNPMEEYRRRHARWSVEQDNAQRIFNTIGNWRLITGLSAAALAFVSSKVGGWWLFGPAVIFILLVIWHQRIDRRRKFAARALRLYQQGINRLNDNWAGTGSQGEAFKDPDHIYADDLDIFGRGSLFELISNARTAAGEALLANWLLAPATLADALERQDAVRELASRLDLREEMALLGEDVQSSLRAETLEAWGSALVVPFPASLRLGALALSLAGILALALRFAEVWPLWPLIVILGINAALIFFLRERTSLLHGSIELAAHHLSLLSLLIARLERERFTSPGLNHLQEHLRTEGIPASQRIRRLNLWLDLLDSSDHIVLRVLNPLLLYRQQIIMAIEAWRSQNGPAIARWIHALARFEALSSLSALHYERPSWTFPHLQSLPAAHFTAVGMSHPLLASSVAISNSLALGSNCRLMIVSGSNMSGKSTLLRAVGLNTVLAWAGAPVCASSIQLSALQVAASLRVSDSLQDNRSRFFAEISRLRQIVDLTKRPTAVLFLLDELLSGTNSHDRRIGASGIVRGLLSANTIGLLTTHDLALSQLDQDAAAPAQNVHFEDRMEDGKIEFDYHLRPGVVTRSNALELMRSIGLEI